MRMCRRRWMPSSNAIPGHAPDRPPERRSGRSAFAKRSSATSITSVIGPSLTSSTCILAPNRPVATSAPSAASSSTMASTSGSAMCAGAAAFHDGRRPLPVSAYRVNWLITSSGASTSAHDFSPSRIRKWYSFDAISRASSAVSSCVTPTRTTRPGLSSPPTVSPPTTTRARLTRCTTARIGASCHVRDGTPISDRTGRASSSAVQRWRRSAVAESLLPGPWPAPGRGALGAGSSSKPRLDNSRSNDAVSARSRCAIGWNADSYSGSGASPASSSPSCGNVVRAGAAEVGQHGVCRRELCAGRVTARTPGPSSG